MHPLDEKYWSKREYWRWWGYACPDDPRIIVSKHPRWAGYTLNFGHRRSLPIFTGIILLMLAPVIACILLAPQNETLVFATIGVVLAVTVAVCHRLANPRIWKEKKFPNHVGLKKETMDAQTQIESFVRNVRARNRRETIACLILLPICACLTVVLPVMMLRYAFALLFLGTVVVLAMLRWPASLRGDLTRYPADNIQHWRGEMLRQAKLLRLVPVWYILPFVPGSVLVLWFDLMVPGKSWVRLVLVMVFVFGFVIWLNFRAARKLEEEARLLSNKYPEDSSYRPPAAGSA